MQIPCKLNFDRVLSCGAKQKMLIRFKSLYGDPLTYGEWKKAYQGTYENYVKFYEDKYSTSCSNL